MALWYCEHCDRHFDTNDQDHADYERNMCEDCVNDISNLGEDARPKDDCQMRPRQVVAVLAQRTFLGPHWWSTGGEV